MSFRKVIEDAYDASSGRVPLLTLHHHWHRYARLARALASQAGDVPAAGSADLSSAVRHTSPTTATDSRRHRHGTRSVDARALGVLLGDAYLGWGPFWRVARRGYSLVAGPRGPNGRRRGRARRRRDSFPGSDAFTGAGRRAGARRRWALPGRAAARA